MPFGLRAQIGRTYRDWEADYRQFARRRGFSSFNDRAFHVRGLITCWGEPGFHRFWLVWNPGIAYFGWRMFLLFGGRKRWHLPLLLSFTANGLVHTLIVAPIIGHWSNVVIIAFACFAGLTILSRTWAQVLRQEQWPTIANVAVNVGLVIGSFDLGFRLDRLL